MDNIIRRGYAYVINWGCTIDVGTAAMLLVLKAAEVVHSNHIIIKGISLN